MKIILITLLALILLTGFCYADYSDWSDINKQLGLAYITTVTADVVQTRYWCEGTKDNPVTTPNGQEIYELNPLIAGRSYLETVAISAAGNYLLYKMVDNLEPQERAIALIAGTLIESYMVYKNSRDIERYGYDGVVLFGLNF